MLRLILSLTPFIFMACRSIDEVEKSGEDGQKRCEFKMEYRGKVQGSNPETTNLIYRASSSTPRICLQHIGKPIQRLSFGLRVSAKREFGRLMSVSIGQGRLIVFDKYFVNLSQGTMWVSNILHPEWSGVLDSTKDIEILLEFNEVHEKITNSDLPTDIRFFVDDQTS